MPDLIKWPSSRRLVEVKQGFKLFRGMDNVIGAIHGIHIAIMGQEEHNENYINRKHYASVLLQGVCDHQLRFTHAYAGWPGSVHTAHVFSNSDLQARILEDPLWMLPNNCYMVGDAAYKLESFMVTPNKNTSNFTEQQKTFNFKQSLTRMVIERTFGLLKSRFTRLKLVEVKNMKELCQFIITACALHNFSVNEDNHLGNDPDDIDFIIEQDEEVNNYVCYGSSSIDGERNRNEILWQKSKKHLSNEWALLLSFLAENSLPFTMAPKLIEFSQEISQDTKISQRFSTAVNNSYQEYGKFLIAKMPVYNRVSKHLSALDPKAQGDKATETYLKQLSSIALNVLAESEMDDYE